MQMSHENNLCIHLEESPFSTNFNTIHLRGREKADRLDTNISEVRRRWAKFIFKIEERMCQTSFDSHN